MAQFTDTLGTNLLKVLYPDGVEELLFKGAPAFAWVPKSTGGGGKGHQLNWIIDGLSSSSTFATALANMTYGTFPTPLVTYADVYCLGSISNKAMALSEGDKKAVKGLLKTQTDQAMYTIRRKLAREIWGDRSGNLGRVSTATAPSTTTITLNSVWDVPNFEKNMFIVGSDVATGASIHASPNRAQITAIDPGSTSTAATLTIDVAYTTSMPGLGTSDYLYEEGSVGSAAGIVMDGFLRWIPITAPTAGDAQYSVDRSVFVTRMAGSRYVGTGPIETRLSNSLSFLNVNGGEPDTIWLHPMRGAELRENVQSLTRYGFQWNTSKAVKMDGSEAAIGVQGFKIVGPNGPVEVLEDRNCPYNYALVTARDSWLLESAGELPHFDKQSGDRLFVEGLSDGKQFRLKGYVNLICKEPVHSCIVTLP